MSKKNPADFDRQEWLTKLANKVRTQKVVSIKLSPKGATFAELKAALGKEFACELTPEGEVRIGVKVKPTPVGETATAE